MKLKTQGLRLATQGVRLGVMQPGSWRHSGMNSNELGYTYRWQQARLRFLHAHPLCVMCEAEGRTQAATVVDHVDPHRGDKVKFWDSANWQALCAHHHSSHKQKQDNAGAAAAVSTGGRV